MTAPLNFDQIVATAAAQGPPGPPPVTTLFTAFAMPAANAQTGSLQFGTTSFFVVGQSLQVVGAGRMVVFSIADGTHAVLTNPGDTGNVAPTTNVPQPASVGVSGAIGPIGAGKATLQTTFAQPNVGSQTPTLTFDTTTTFAVGLYVQVVGGGIYTVFSIADGTHAVFTNAGGPTNVSPTTSVTSPAAVSASGPGGVAPGTAAQIPITNAGATAVVQQTVSQDVSITSTGIASVQGATIPAAIAAPAFFQIQAASGAGQIHRYATQAAATGAVANGGDHSTLLGKRDGAVGGTLQIVWWGESLAVDPRTVNEAGATNYYNYMRIFRNASNNVNLALGGGNNNAGGGVSSVEISWFSPGSIATESNTNFTSAYTGDSLINLSPGLFQNVNFHASYNVRTNLDGSPLLQIGAAAGNALNGVNGCLNFEWLASSVHQAILSQHASTSTGNDFEIVSRYLGLLTFGSYAENNQRNALDTLSLNVLRNSSSGVVVRTVSPSTGGLQTQMAVATDTQTSIVQGDVLAGTSDARIIQKYATNTATTSAGTVIATIPIRTNAVHHLYARIEGKSGTDYASFLHEWTVLNNAGTVTIASSQPAAIDKGHTAAAINIIPQFAVSGTNITITVTPWTATATHWTCYVESMVNMSSATSPSAPTPQSVTGVQPSFFWRADLVGTGALASLVDQSGSGHNFAAQATQQVNTANAGPNGAQNGLVMAGTGYYALANGLSVGPNNYTVGIIAKVTSTAAQNAIVEIGQSSGVQLGVDTQGTSSRDTVINRFGAGQIAASASPATTNWEAWVFTCDSGGRLTLLVNGVPQAVSPMSTGGQGIAATANSTIGAATPSTNKMVGTLFEVIVWNQAVDPAVVYYYQHAITGL